MPKHRICLVIPTLNEASAIGKVLDEVPREVVDETIVVDNGSMDNTAEIARTYGALVIFEPRKGYGNACLAAIRALEKIDPAIVVFIDGDSSSDPREIDKILIPILKDKANLVVGNRASSMMEKGSMPLHAKLGNKLALMLLKILYGKTFSDLGPFRAIKWKDLISLRMKDQTYGWNVEMMIKAIRLNLSIQEVDVSYRKRIGESKISGSPLASIKAGYRIVSTIIRYSFS